MPLLVEKVEYFDFLDSPSYKLRFLHLKCGLDARIFHCTDRTNNIKDV